MIVEGVNLVCQRIAEVEGASIRAPAERVGNAEAMPPFGDGAIGCDPVEDALARGNVAKLAIRKHVVLHRADPEVSEGIGATVIQPNTR